MSLTLPQRDASPQPSQTETEDVRLALARRITLAIPTLNEAPFIRACLHSLLMGSEAHGALDVMVLDGGSTDGTKAAVAEMQTQFPNIRWIENEGVTPAHALNLAAQISDPCRDILIRCDAHSLYPRDFVLNVATQLVMRDVASIVVPVKAAAAPGANDIAKATALIADTLLGAGGAAHRKGAPSGYVDHGHHAAMWRDIFLTVGGYETVLIANEDAEFDTRLINAGYRIWLAAELPVTLYVRPTLSSLWRQYRRYGVGRAQHLIAHGKSPRLRQAMPVLHVQALLLSLMMLPFTLIGLVYPLFYLTITGLAGIITALARKTRIGWLSPASLWVMHTAWGTGFLTTLIKRTFFGERKHP